MTKNQLIIASELARLGIKFQYDGQNLLTFQEWKKRGFYVRRGEKAFLQVPLWTFCEKTVKKNGKEEKQTYFILKKASLFAPSQVERLEQKGA